MRQQSMEKLFELTRNMQILRIAVVGGSRDEPELQFWPDAQIEIFGVDQESTTKFLDLNMEPTEPLEKYDLVLCNHVLEHVWNHSQAFSNLAKLLHPNGLVWISTPAAFYEHGSPDYFVAGFDHNWLSKQVQYVNLEVVESGFFASRRIYLAGHLFDMWLETEHIRKPLSFIKLGSSSLERLHRLFKFGFKLLLLRILPESNSSRYATVSYLLGSAKV